MKIIYSQKLLVGEICFWKLLHKVGKNVMCGIPLKTYVVTSPNAYEVGEKKT